MQTGRRVARQATECQVAHEYYTASAEGVDRYQREKGSSLSVCPLSLSPSLYCYLWCPLSVPHLISRSGVAAMCYVTAYFLSLLEYRVLDSFSLIP